MEGINGNTVQAHGHHGHPHVQRPPALQETEYVQRQASQTEVQKNVAILTTNRQRAIKEDDVELEHLALMDLVELSEPEDEDERVRDEECPDDDEEDDEPWLPFDL